MSLYDLPEFKLPSKNQLPKNLKKIRLTGKRIVKSSLLKKYSFRFIILNILISALVGFLAGALAVHLEYSNKFNQEDRKIIIENTSYVSQILQEQAVIKVAAETSPSVVSITVNKAPAGEYYDALEEFSDFFGDDPIPEEIGSGTGFIISSDGMILTNKHVVSDKEANYTILTSNGQEFSAVVLARDPFKDLAVLKIDSDKNDFRPVVLGDSDKLQVGQSVISIGNALGEYNNTISVGIVSGLGRKIVASGGGITEKLEDLIQTDAAINRGNSGGPLLNLAGEVIGVNVAMSAEAENIGFSIPINDAKKDIKMVKEIGEIIYPFLGIRYLTITPALQQEDDLPVDYGVFIARGENLNEVAVTPDSAAETAGLEEGDILLEFNRERITIDNSLSKIIQKYNPGDKVTLKVLRDEQEIIMEAVLGKRNF